MRKYEKPDMEILLMNEVEVITTSNNSPVLSTNPEGEINSSTDFNEWF